jgi:hypothetical protein
MDGKIAFSDLASVDQLWFICVACQKSQQNRIVGVKKSIISCLTLHLGKVRGQCHARKLTVASETNALDSDVLLSAPGSDSFQMRRCMKRFQP